ncbi:hypothetical protein TrVFT333_000095 [Trichoderma virens FT-333]|nr:hypothetical protein TrVFT333_000095 [Trichoderma virens FT-333]
MSIFQASGDRLMSGRSGITTSDISDILASRFLDPEIFSLLQLETPKVEVAIPKMVADYVGTIVDIQNIANAYFDTIHTWMPILSKKQFFSNLPNYLTHKKTELCLLVICMKLSSSLTTTAKTVLYRTAKQFHFEVESSGILSVAVLQAGVLIAIYELGHAIYPAAFLSIGQCARYAAALEIDKSITSRLLDKLPGMRWKNSAECGDPTPDSYLPGDDLEWDTGSSRSENSLTLGSSSGSYIGRFARFAQTAHLLSQALYTVAKDPTTDPAQLRRTLMALVNLSFMEGTMRKWAFCSQMAVCFRGVPKGKLIKLDGGIDAYLSTASDKNVNKGIGILFAPEAMGIYPNSQLLADSFAAKGYTTLIPDVFNGDAVPLNKFATIDLMSWLTKGSNGNNPHTTEYVDPIIVAGIKALRQLGIHRIGGVGYCFGAKYVLRHSKSGIDAAFIAHPSFVEEDELASFSGPLSIAAAETDSIFTTTMRHKSEDILIKSGQPFQINLYSGVEHGFGIRGDPSVKLQKFAKEQAFSQAIIWFDEFLLKT